MRQPIFRISRQDSEALTKAVIGLRLTVVRNKNTRDLAARGQGRSVADKRILH